MFSFLSSLKELCFYVALSTDTLVSCILWRTFFTISSTYASFSYLVPLPSHLNPSSLSLLRATWISVGHRWSKDNLPVVIQLKKTALSLPETETVLNPGWRIQSCAGGHDCNGHAIHRRVSPFSFLPSGSYHLSIPCPWWATFPSWWRWLRENMVMPERSSWLQLFRNLILIFFLEPWKKSASKMSMYAMNRGHFEYSIHTRISDTWIHLS